MKRIAIDTGPLVAFLNVRDTHHQWAKETLDGITAPLYTCEAVISEACFLVRHIKGGSDAVFELMARDLVRIDFTLRTDMPAVRKLLAKYVAVPMSLADACLVRMTELHPETTVVTVDRDFRIYRRNGRQVVPAILPDESGR